MTRFNSSFPEHQVSEDWVNLHATGAEVATGTGSVVAELPAKARAIVAAFDLTAVGTLVGDTFDLYVQTKLEQSGTDVWVDVIHFVQSLGNGGVLRYYDKIVAALDQATFEDGDALGAGAKRHLFGSEWRCRWVIVDGGGTHSFTFTCTLQPVSG